MARIVEVEPLGKRLAAQKPPLVPVDLRKAAIKELGKVAIDLDYVLGAILVGGAPWQQGAPEETPRSCITDLDGCGSQLLERAV